MRRLVAAGVLMAALASAAVGVAADDAIDPDRPDVSSSTKTVGRGRVQLESGLLVQRTRVAGEPTERRLSAETMLRVGLTDDLEIRVEGEPIVRLRGPADAVDVGDFTLSLKWRVVDSADGSAWPSVALNPFLKLPTAPEPIGSGRTDAGLLLITGFDLPARFALDVNAGLAVVGQTRPGGSRLQALTSASLSREIAGSVTAFGEIFYASREERGGRDQVGVDAGVIWTILSNVALDAAVGTSLYGRLPDVFVRAGGSVRFGR